MPLEILNPQAKEKHDLNIILSLLALKADINPLGHQLLVLDPCILNQSTVVTCIKLFVCDSRVIGLEKVKVEAKMQVPAVFRDTQSKAQRFKQQGLVKILDDLLRIVAIISKQIN